MGGCRKEFCTYRIVCNTFPLDGKTAHYIGETSKTPLLRGAEHIKGRDKKDEEKDPKIVVMNLKNEFNSQRRIVLREDEAMKDGVTKDDNDAD